MFDQNGRVVNNLQLRFLFFSPTMDLILPVLSMECSEKRPGNQFSVSLLRYWANEYPRELAQLIGQQLCKQASGTKKRK